jgi:hypothetical protein
LRYDPDGPEKFLKIFKSRGNIDTDVIEKQATNSENRKEMQFFKVLADVLGSLALTEGDPM